MSRNRRRAIIITAVLILVTAGVAYAAIAIRTPGRGVANNPLVAAWDTAVAPTSSDSGTLGDPLTFGMAPSRDVDAGQTTVAYVSGKLSPTTTSFYAGYLATVQGSIITSPSTFKLQRVVLTNLAEAGTTPFTPGTEIQAFVDPAECGKAMNDPDRTYRIGIKFPTAPPTGANYAFGLELEFVNAGSYAAATCNGWS